MITAVPHPTPPAHTLLASTSSVRSARAADAPALADLCRPFVRSGALRERPASVYVTHAADFLVTEVPGGPLEGCVGLRVLPAGSEEGRGPAGVLYNFCVAGHRQGHGVGAALLRTVLSVARARSLGALFTATTGGGRLFLRYGFAPTTAQLAPRSWAQSLDPRRDARILAKTL